MPEYTRKTKKKKDEGMTTAEAIAYPAIGALAGGLGAGALGYYQGLKGGQISDEGLPAAAGTYAKQLWLDPENPKWQKIVAGGRKHWDNSVQLQHFLDKNNVNLTPEEFQVISKMGTPEYQGHMEGTKDNQIMNKIIGNLKNVVGSEEDSSKLNKLLQWHSKHEQDVAGAQTQWVRTPSGNRYKIGVPKSLAPAFSEVQDRTLGDPRVAHFNIVNPQNVNVGGYTSKMNVPDIQYEHPLDTYQKFHKVVDPFMRELYQKVQWQPDVYDKRMVLSDRDIDTRAIFDMVHKNQRSMFGDKLNVDPTHWFTNRAIEELGLNGSTVKESKLRNYFYQHHGGPMKTYDIMSPYIMRGMLHNQSYKYASDTVRAIHQHFKDAAAKRASGEGWDPTQADLQIHPMYTAGRLMNSVVDPQRGSAIYDPAKYYKVVPKGATPLGGPKLMINNDNFTPTSLGESNWKDQLDKIKEKGDGGQAYYWDHASEMF